MTSIGNPQDRTPQSAPPRSILPSHAAATALIHILLPPVSYRIEEESVILELGNRHLTAGFAGEQYPRCRLGFGREESRRAGDYRKYLPGYSERATKRRRLDNWGDEAELWRLDLRSLELGIVHDKVERAVREAYNKYLLLDSKSRKICLIVPSVLPHQLLNTILHTLFENFQIPSVTLLSPPIMSTAAAGCRSGLVVDIGWRETIVTSIYDYRKIRQHRTIRGMRLVTSKMAQLLHRAILQDSQNPVDVPDSDSRKDEVSVDLEEAEEATARIAWCNPRQGCSDKDPPSDTSLNDLTPTEKPTTPTPKSATLTTIPHPHSPRSTLQIPFTSFAIPVESTLLIPQTPRFDHDDHDQPLPHLIYKSLLSLPPDVRATCMSRLIFVGGGSHIPGLKSRLVSDLKAMIDRRGFDGVEGKASDERKRRIQELSAKTPTESTKGEEAEAQTNEKGAKVPASEQPQTIDDIDVNLQKERDKYAKPAVAGVVRAVESLGAWAGGSLVASLRIRGIVDIERDTFLQYGMAGGLRRELELGQGAQQRKSYVGDMGRGIGDPRGSWTLGAWA
ncbi:uncharacterized protein KY384_007263 [Bacidia gigantensis]|uniref:uncharacterized protein n=1 Tax=Bacidia gigantensis TaxID=2732470 RepID=UPI001D04C7C2|nr:uncharacterized protein KY384_007263 [Bacidia gigantensis]KAG8528345.1 hypothetical protein KY384_007263 [Bacidia gigantensis]